MKTLLSLMVAGAMSASAAHAQVVFSDDFESYADLTAVLASPTWSLATGNIELNAALSASTGTKSIRQPVGGVGRLIGNHTAVDNATLSPTNTLVVTFFFHDSDAASAGSTRTGLSYGGYVDANFPPFGALGLENFVAFGTYNVAPAVTTQYAHRVVFGGGGWQTSGVVRTTGWREFTIIFNGTAANFFVDGAASAANPQTYTAPAGGFDSIRLGDFIASAVSGLDISFDDFNVEIVTPPTSVENWHLYQSE